jgi:hypothetical protein
MNEEKFIDICNDFGIELKTEEKNDKKFLCVDDKKLSNVKFISDEIIKLEVEKE